MNDFAEFLRKAAAENAAKAPISSVFSEEPVSLTIFVQDKAYLGNPPLSPVQYEAVQHIERVYYPGTYDMLSEEFEGGKKAGRLHVGPAGTWREEAYWSQPIRMINHATLQWGKGSTSINTPIYNARTGRWVPIRDWNSEDLVGAAYPEDGKVFATAGTAAFREGHGRMFKVRTRKGHEIEVWEGHRFLTWAKRRWSSSARVARFAEAKGAAWARLWDLEVGDPIAIASCVPEPTQCATVDDRDVELVGLWLGNGCMTPCSGCALVFGDQSPLARQRATELFESLPDTWVKQVFDTSDGSTRWRIQPKADGDPRRSSPAAARLAQWYGLAGKAAAGKAIPEQFYSLDNRQTALLLSRLIDTDGWISFSNTAEIGYGTISKQLAIDIQRLMLRLGAVAELKEKHTRYKGEPYLSYQIRVRDRRSLAALAQRLTLLDKEAKRLELLDWLQARAGRRQRADHGDLVWDKIESIEYVGDDDYYTLSVDGPASYISSNGIFDHNSGKDHICRVASMRIAYLLMCLDSPQEYYGMPEQDTIHLLNVASSSQQAQQAFFMPITRAVKRGWFANRCQPKQNVISYAKNVESVSGHSDAEGQEGLNLMLGIADEIDAFKSKKETAARRGATAREPTKSAEAIIEMMRTSGSTRFPEVFKNVRISYPRYKGSTIQRLTDEARTDIKQQGIDSRHYVSGPLATWIVNPRVPGREAFAADYREDPILARSKYECKPSRAINPYFRNHQAVDSCLIQRDTEPIAVTYHIEHSAARRVWVPRYTYSPDFYPVRGAVYAMHADMAVSGDRAGIAMAHVVRWEEREVFVEDEDGAPHPFREIRPHVNVDFVAGYSSDPSCDPPREIQIRWARQLAFDLVTRGFNIKRFSFDSFQSTDSMQILESKGIETAKVSTDLHEDPWRNLRDLLYEGRVRIPAPKATDPANPPPFLLRDELLSLTRLPNGRIDHPSDGSKDLADALACAVLGAMQCGGSEAESGERAWYGEPHIAVGGGMPLPLGSGQLSRLWERELPSPF